MRARVVTVLFLAVGVINLLPVIGVASVTRVEALYGIGVGGDPNLAILMRHRALLFGVVAALLFAAAFRESMRTAATVAGLFSMLSFVTLALGTEGYNMLLRRVVIADVIGSALLVVAAAMARRPAPSSRAAQG